MIDKTRLGIPLFDERFGGIYRKRSALCVGRHGSGKTIAALHFLMQSIREGERGLMLSAWKAHDLAIVADTMGFHLEDAVKGGEVTLLEYADIMPTQDSEKNLTLPPGSFMEFQDIIDAQSIRRVAIDSVLPWVAIHQEDKLSKHVYSFVQAIERMGVTALMTLPKPVSALAFALKNRLEEQIPVVFTLDVDEKENRTLTLNKYLGDSKLPPPIPILIEPKVGIVKAPQALQNKTQTARMSVDQARYPQHPQQQHAPVYHPPVQPVHAAYHPHPQAAPPPPPPPQQAQIPYAPPVHSSGPKTKQIRFSDAFRKK